MSADWRRFYDGRRVLVTGHTGFKGAWMAHWLASLGADVVGFALPALPDSIAARVGTPGTSIHGDVRDLAAVRAVFEAHEPEIVFHLAAQAFVRRSYREPVDTFATNVMGTVNVLEAARSTGSARAVVVVTTDKVYENRGLGVPFRESDPLGGRDPYSASKAAAEVATAAFRQSFPGVPTASARAGNVIGGGDFGEERLVPDIARALLADRPVVLRNPTAVRPWQHVLEPLRGYLMLAERLAAGVSGLDAFNFGPAAEGVVTVQALVERVIAAWGAGSLRIEADPNAPHEAHTLTLDWERARTALDWHPWLDLDATVRMTVDGYKGAPIAAQLAEYLAHEPR